MQILYYENGDILAVGDMAEIDNVFYVNNDPDIADVKSYSLVNFEVPVILDNLVVDLPENFKKCDWKYLNGEFIPKDITGNE